MAVKDILQVLKLKYYLRKTHSIEYSLNSKLSNPKRIVILLPNKNPDQKIVKDFILELSKLYNNSELLFIGQPGTQITLIKTSQTMNFHKIKLSQLSWSGLPGKEFISIIKDYHADLLIDLSVKKDNFNAFIAAVSQIPIRLGKYDSWGSPVYNFEVKSNHLQNEQLIHKSMLDVLRSIKAGATN